MRSTRLLLAASLLAVAACDTTRTGGAPGRAFLTVVQVDDAPLSDGGEGWDGSVGGGPEVYFRLYPAAAGVDQCPGTDVLNPRDDAFVVSRFSDAPWVEDVDGAAFPLVWDVDPGGRGFEVRDLNRLYRVVLCDYDPFDSDEDIAATEPFTFAAFAPSVTDGADDVIALGGAGVRVVLRAVFVE